MPAINYYVPDSKYAELVYEAHRRDAKVKALIDEALDEWLKKLQEAQSQ